MQTLAALLTPTVAFFGALIAFMQWRTAHSKVMLDMFDRRWRVFQSVSEYYLLLVRNGMRPYDKELAEFHKVRAEAAFLFGEDIQQFLKDLHHTSIEVSTHASCAQDIESPERPGHIKAGYSALKSIYNQGQRLEAVFSPYMRMDQKRVRTLGEWLRDRNELRKSYSDPPPSS